MELRAIAEQNYQKILDLSTGAGQEEFVARNVRSLARALYRSLGFWETGSTLNGEIQMELILE